MRRHIGKLIKGLVALGVACALGFGTLEALTPVQPVVQVCEGCGSAGEPDRFCESASCCDAPESACVPGPGGTTTCICGP